MVAICLTVDEGSASACARSANGPKGIKITAMVTGWPPFMR